MSRILVASAFLFAAAVQAAAQQLHPCDDRTPWTRRGGDSKALSSPQGKPSLAALERLQQESGRFQGLPDMQKFLLEHGLALGQANPREKIDAADAVCLNASPDQRYFVQCDAVMSRVYSEAGPPLAKVKDARERLKLVCEKYDQRRQAYLARVKREAAERAAKPAVQQASMIGFTDAPAPAAPAPVAPVHAPPKSKVAAHVSPYDPRLLSAECRQLCQAYLAFGTDGCFSGLDADMRRWCEEKSAKVQAAGCVCR
jgi:hypothetical protein